MNPIGGVKAILGATGDGGVDWPRAGDAARDLTDSGTLEISARVREGYATDIKAAHREVSAVSGIEFAVPQTLEVQNRHHWIDGTLETLELGFEPLANAGGSVPAVTGPVNTASVAGSVAYLSRRVLGQYDPHLFSDAGDHGLYIVHPNIVAGATELSVDFERFRRWIAFHEVTHAAEFGAAPWLRGYLSDRVRRIVAELTQSSVPRKPYRELNRAMTAVEGYAELLMDEAFDEQSADLRRKLDDRRDSGGPFARLIGRLLGLDIKRNQYERGRAFFEVIEAERGLAGASRVWDESSYLPRSAELETPSRWLDRVPPADGP